MSRLKRFFKRLFDALERGQYLQAGIDPDTKEILPGEPWIDPNSSLLL